MQPPMTKKEIQSLTERLAALNRFISRYSDRLHPFFKALKRANTKGWGPKCEKAFQAIKEYVASPLSLSQPVEGEELYLYMSSSETIVSTTLVRLDSDKKQRPVYFVRKALSVVEIGYSDFERVALALRTVAKKLWPYFQAHTIVVLTSSPIKAIFHKPDTSWRLLKWAIQLSEFDIDYRPRTSIKGQVLVDFVVERSKMLT